MKIYLPILCACILLLSSFCLAQDADDAPDEAPSGAPPPEAPGGDGPPAPAPAPAGANPESEPVPPAASNEPAEGAPNPSPDGDDGDSPTGGPEAANPTAETPSAPNPTTAKAPTTTNTPTTSAKTPVASNTTLNSTLNRTNTTTNATNGTMSNNYTINGTLPTVIRTQNLTTYFAKAGSALISGQQMIFMWNSTYDAGDFRSLTLGFTTTTDTPGWFAMGISSNGQMIGSKAWTCFQGAPMLYELDLKGKSQSLVKPSAQPIAKNISMMVAVQRNVTTCSFVLTIPLTGGLQAFSKSTFNTTDAFKGNTFNLIFARGRLPTGDINTLLMHTAVGTGKVTLDVPTASGPAPPKKSDAEVMTNKFLWLMCGAAIIPHLL